MKRPRTVWRAVTVAVYFSFFNIFLCLGVIGTIQPMHRIPRLEKIITEQERKIDLLNSALEYHHHEGDKIYYGGP